MVLLLVLCEDPKVYTSKDKNGEEVFWFALALKMKEMNPSPWVVGEDIERQEACEKALDNVVRFNGGHDLVEEFVGSGVWPLDRNTWRNFCF